MDHLTSQQRKLSYLGGIVVLMFPIVWLGLPEGADPSEDKGGKLAMIRSEADLGQSSLGNVDPASSTMTLVLFGFRGIAASMLWYESDQLKQQKNWSELERTAESIVLLQPHFWNVWDQQAWNLAYNVSAEFDDVKDRFFWVKRGAKFLKTGIERNQRVPELYHYMGEFVGRKIGYSDEKDLFRKFFVNDPDERFDRDGVPDNDGRPEDDWMDNLPDPELNPDGLDNYLLARNWYLEANRVLMGPARGEQHKLADILFRAGPYKSMMEYAQARSREGKYDPETRRAWEQALRDWLEEYGRMEFSTLKGMVTLNGTPEELQQIADREREEGLGDYTLDDKIHHQGREQDLTNYRYWATLCEVEMRPDMVEARRRMYAGRLAWLDLGDAVKANQELLTGMAMFENILTTYKDGLLLKQDEGNDFIEDAMEAVLLLRSINAGKPLPEDYPLKTVFENPDPRYVGIREETESRFSRRMFND